MSRYRRAALIIAAALLACAVVSERIVAQAQTITRQSTPGGLEFRYVQMPEALFQSLYFAWRDGTAVALPGQEAVPTVGANLIMEGPRHLSRSAMIEEFRDLQATVSLSAQVSLVQGQLTAPRGKFSASVRLFAHVLGDPALPNDRFVELKKSATIAIRQGDGNAETMAQRLFSRLLIADGPYRRYLGGEASVYSGVTLADVDAWRRNILVRNGLILVSAGPMDATEAGREIDTLFAGLPASGNPPAAAKPVLRAPGKLVVLERPVVQTAIVAGGPMNLAITPDLLRTQLAVSVLGSGVSSRLWRAVREKLGAAYGISGSMQSVDLHTRLLTIRTAVANDKAAGGIGAIREEYRHILADGITDAEIDPLKRAAVTGHRERMQPRSRISGGLALAGAERLPGRLSIDLRAAPAGLRAGRDRGRHAPGVSAIAVDLRGGGALGRRPGRRLRPEGD